MHLTKHFDYARLHSDQALPVVLLVPVVGDAAVVHHVEDSDKPGSDLEEGGEAAVLGQRVLVVPPGQILFHQLSKINQPTTHLQYALDTAMPIAVGEGLRLANQAGTSANFT